MRKQRASSGKIVSTGMASENSQWAVVRGRMRRGQVDYEKGQGSHAKSDGEAFHIDLT